MSTSLLTKYAPAPGRNANYALVAGFTEIGETLEETVQREVMEEVGLKVKNIRYYKSQPWSFSSTLLCGFFCEVDGDTDITLDTEELAVGEWFDRDNIPVEDDGVSLTREMIGVFKTGGEKEYDELRQYVLSEPADAENTTAADHTEEDSENEGDATASTSQRMDRIDLASLQEINNEAIGWIEIPGTDISYPDRKSVV